jgi:murein DD-endopeptidase MepM/ murein hydrolase activator NlpD
LPQTVCRSMSLAVGRLLITLAALAALAAAAATPAWANPTGGVSPPGSHPARPPGSKPLAKPASRAGGVGPAPVAKGRPPGSRTGSGGGGSRRAHVFPVRGPSSFGGPDARFGAARTGHIHQGQDVVAAEGTPLVAVRRGLITWRGYQAGGAGYYLVLDAAGELFDYVYMHLERGSVRVHQGQRVRTGQRIGRVGSTGDSTGPHLHFEVWRGHWFGGGHPIDPLPFLKRWLHRR